MLISKCFVLCVSDVDQIAASGDGLIPDPHIGDFRICRIAIESRLYVPFQIDTSCIRINGVIPAVHGFAVQRKTDTLGIALGKADPIANVKCRLCWFFLRRFGRLWLFCRFWFFRCRRCGLFLFGRCRDFRMVLGLVRCLGRFAYLWRRCAAVRLFGCRFCLNTAIQHACRCFC